MQTSIGALVTQAAKQFGNKTAVIFEGRLLSFADIDLMSTKVATHLESLGVQRDQVVALYSQNCPEWIIAYYAILKIGAVVSPLNLMLTGSEAAFALADCKAVAVFATADKLSSLQEHVSSTQLTHLISIGESSTQGALSFSTLIGDTATLNDYPVAGLSPESISTIGYTSGTTGHPKGAVLTHANILMNVAMTATMHVRTESDTTVSALPLSHVYGNVVMNAAIAYGTTLVLHKSFDAEAVLTSIQEHRATILEGVPTMYMYILDHPRLSEFDLSSLRRCTVGGQTMPEAKMQEVERLFGCRLLELWGMTELGGLGATHSFYGPRRLGSIGVPLPQVEARVIDPEHEGEEVPAGEIGELQIRGPITMKEYLGRPDATLETKYLDGWLRTGDLARIDSEGFIYVVDRLKDMIITAGFNIYPAELERAICEHPAVAMVAVGSVPDSNKGELAKAYIVKKKGIDLDLDDLEKHCRARLAAYKVPRLYQLVEELPKTSSGKIMRRMLRNHFES
ncbi:AMP-binding protein [Pseudomonas hefeiensis]|uniref:AMP-binding protein n=1 Tax=Pseudomonas hefeiensis TaxID=2738125 RepID=A0ABY9GGT0_9PSED|nr:MULTISPECIES: AMP-binding protein [unclassified Pseudomonas]WLH14823.1 AMP-binding protein [Pseudomonas sp. FP205]WLH97875.1 AMP-binding protein [Pseudomonas sp. FP53]WLI42149.1 AMP-binding protein [Pseudomonas sp. FP821]